MKKQIVKEVYVAFGEEFASLRDAVDFVYKKLSSENYYSASIERRSYYEADGDDCLSFLSGNLRYKVTGEACIPGPASMMMNPGLSRYHPVNGWVVPESIDVICE